MNKSEESLDAKSVRARNVTALKKQPAQHIWVLRVPQNGWFIMENPIKMDDLGVPLFSETPISIQLISILPRILEQQVTQVQASAQQKVTLPETNPASFTPENWWLLKNDLFIFGMAYPPGN